MSWYAILKQYMTKEEYEAANPVDKKRYHVTMLDSYEQDLSELRAMEFKTQHWRIQETRLKELAKFHRSQIPKSLRGHTTFYSLDEADLENRIKQRNVAMGGNKTLQSTNGRVANYKYNKPWQRNVAARPDNWNKINTIVLHLKRQNKPINRQTILEELLDKPTNEDNLAIEYVLKELEQ